MPNDWIPNTATQIERAIRALVVAKAAAPPERVYISNDSEIREGDNITILAATSSTEGAELSGIEVYQVAIQHKFGAAIQPDETNPDKQRRTMDESVGRTMFAMMNGEPYDLRPAAADITSHGRALAVSDGTEEGDLRAENNADMAEFTCQFVRYVGATRGKPDDNSCQWVEVRNFEVTACPSNTD